MCVCDLHEYRQQRRPVSRKRQKVSQYSRREEERERKDFYCKKTYEDVSTWAANEREREKEKERDDDDDDDDDNDDVLERSVIPSEGRGGGWKSQYDRNRERPILRNISLSQIPRVSSFWWRWGAKRRGLCVVCVCWWWLAHCTFFLLPVGDFQVGS